jgi:hypothetical protein
MVSGTAYRPFVYRQLAPTAIGMVDKLLPARVKDKIEAKFTTGGLHSDFARYMRWTPGQMTISVLAVGFVFGCLVGLMYALRWMSKLVYDCSPIMHDIAPILVVSTLPIFWWEHKYIYDPSVMVLSTLAIGLTIARKPAWYYLVFALAVLNKETSLLLIPVFAIISRHLGMSSKRLCGHIAIQMLIWISVCAWLHSRYGHNPGTSLEFHLLDHNLALVYLRSKLRSCLFVIFAFIVLRPGWMHVPLYIRRGFALTTVVLFVLTLLFGWIEEIRDFLELAPFIQLLLIPSLCRMYDCKMSLVTKVYDTTRREVAHTLR